jgi:hypothetical protein
MKFKHSIIALSIATLVATSPALLAGRGGHGGHGGNGGNGNNDQSVSISQLSPQEAESLSFMREEEKLARDVYITLYEQWNNEVFSNISSSEQRHMEIMRSRLEDYGLTDPVTDDSVGVFNNPELQELYWELVARGQNSELDALYVGGFIEEFDIIDLQNAIGASEHADVTRSYQKLMRGSGNHLRAFVRQIENRGIPYEAQKMSQDEVDSILDQRNGKGGRGNR